MYNADWRYRRVLTLSNWLARGEGCFHYH